MPPAKRKYCEYPGCKSGPPDDVTGAPTPYISDEDCVTRAEVLKDIKQHCKMAHELPLQLQQNNTKQYEAETERSKLKDKPTSSSDKFNEKRDAIPRPKVEENTSASEWSFFKAQWARYTNGSHMTEAQELHQLWAACPDALQRQLHYGGAGNITVPEQLMQEIRLLAVKRRNNLVSMVEFQRMGQNQKETITAFISRLMGQASVCDMVVKCQGCQEEVSFADTMILYQFVRGLTDTQMQERIMESAAQVETGKLSLTKVVKIAEAFEMGKNSQELVNSGGAQVSKISQYQKNKNTARQTTRSQSGQQDRTKCGNCGKGDHTSKLQDRRDKCPAFDKMCQKCNTNGHFASQCRGGPRVNREKSTDKSKPSNNSKSKDTKVNEVKEKENVQDDADLGTLHGHWMLINGLQPQQHNNEVSDEYSSELREAHPVSPFPSPKNPSLYALSKKDSVKKLRHHIMDEFGRWKPANVQPHGKLLVHLQVSHSAAEQLQLPVISANKTTVHALADTGAQMCVADWSVARQMGMSKSDLMVPALSVSVADNSSLELLGATFMTISSPSGESSEQLIYFAHDVGQFYLSNADLMDLKVIPRDFPKIGSCSDTLKSQPSSGSVYEVQDGFPSGRVQPLHSGSHRQVAPPPKPTCSSSASSPCVPQGMTSLGSRPPMVMEGGIMVESEVELRSPQNPRTLVNKPNVDRVSTVRASQPPVTQNVVDPPQELHHHLPSPLSLPPGPPLGQWGQGVDPGGAFQRQQRHQVQVQAGAAQGCINPVQINAHPRPTQDFKVKDNNSHSYSGVQVQDLGPEWQLEFPDYQTGSGTWPINQPPVTGGVHEVQGGFPSALHQASAPQRDKVQFDSMGRELAPCGCLKRSPPPPPPKQPPFPLTPENIPRLESWMLNTYAASAFNVCPHQPLPKMTGLPPLRIHIKEGSTPTAVHKPSTIPVHWIDKIRDDLERDIQLGVIERVPSNTPTTWCSRMHVVSKKDGEPRKVVDLRAVNSATKADSCYRASLPPSEQCPPKHLEIHVRRMEWIPFHSP